MLCILSNNIDVFFNLSAEEYLLKHVDEDIIMLWKSSPSVVIGKHQNAFAEINSEYIRNNEISVARRLTGGGTVFHDTGNLNFTFIKNGEDGKLVDFKKFISPIIEFLETLRITATFGLKNEILINNLKISGNAEHVHKRRVLHHGTLLFNSDLEKLGHALKVKPGRYIDKAVQSNRSMVTNISHHLADKISFDNFIGRLFNFLVKKFSGSVYSIQESNIMGSIIKLRNEKYYTWEWVYGYTPPFSLQRNILIENRECKFSLKIVKGIIDEIQFDIKSNEKIVRFFEGLTGLRFDYRELVNYLDRSELDEKTKIELPGLLF